MSDSFMAAFSAQPEVPRMLGDLLLNDSRVIVRKTTALLIRQTTGTVAEGERYARCSRVPCWPEY